MIKAIPGAPCRIDKPFVRPPWCRERFPSVFEGDSLTSQSEGDNTDVNLIVERFSRTGFLPPAQREPQYADVTGLQGDLTELYERSHEVLGTAEAFASGWSPPPDPVVPPSPGSPPVNEPPA